MSSNTARKLKKYIVTMIESQIKKNLGQKH